jgi:hypothetical protein
MKKMTETQIRRIILKEMKRRGTHVNPLYDWALDIAECTRGRSGFFGVPFCDLLPVMDRMAQEELMLLDWD